MFLSTFLCEVGIISLCQSQRHFLVFHYCLLASRIVSSKQQKLNKFLLHKWSTRCHCIPIEIWILRHKKVQYSNVKQLSSGNAGAGPKQHSSGACSLNIYFLSRGGVGISASTTQQWMVTTAMEPFDQNIPRWEPRNLGQLSVSFFLLGWTLSS